MDSMRPDKGPLKSEPSTKSTDESESSIKPTDYPGMWRVPTNPKHCCIYRVPEILRRVNPEAYTPQLLLIGPLHHSLKSQALKSLGGITDTKLMGYLNMEAHKKFYLAEFRQRVDREKLSGEETIDGFRRIIEEKEEIIRESYSESTAWIKSSEFVEMILHDSVFIIEFILRFFNLRSTEERNKIGDRLMDEPCLRYALQQDLILIENQLPYFILEELFDPVLPALPPYQRISQMIISHFDFDGYVRNSSEFKHFTDLARCVRVETLQELAPGTLKQIDHMHNADKLNIGGVKFEAVENKFSLYVKFENGCLKIPCLRVYDDLEMKLRNIMAFEQCHYPYSAHVCNYFIFLDFLVHTDKDVNLLAEKGIIKNCSGEHGWVAETVNKLCLHIIDYGSYYSNIATEVNAHYTNPFNRSRAVLKSVYFGNIWIGTATIAAMSLLLMTLIQTVASVIQVVQNARSPK